MWRIKLVGTDGTDGVEVTDVGGSFLRSTSMWDSSDLSGFAAWTGSDSAGVAWDDVEAAGRLAEALAAVDAEHARLSALQGEEAPRSLGGGNAFGLGPAGRRRTLTGSEGAEGGEGGADDDGSVEEGAEVGGHVRGGAASRRESGAGALLGPRRQALEAPRPSEGVQCWPRGWGGRGRAAHCAERVGGAAYEPERVWSTADGTRRIRVGAGGACGVRRRRRWGPLRGSERFWGAANESERQPRRVPRLGPRLCP